MRLLLPLSIFLIAAAFQDDIRKERELLQGTWKVVRVEVNGQRKPEEEKAQVVITAKKFIVKKEGKPEEANFLIDPAKKPRSIDLITGGGEDKVAVLQGIYELAGDDLKLCLSLPDKDRPTEFASKEGRALIILKREK